MNLNALLTSLRRRRLRTGVEGFDRSGAVWHQSNDRRAITSGCISA